jgi:hypothetical protein
MRILGWIFLPFVMIFKNWQQRSVWGNIIGSLFAVSMLSFYVLLLFVTLNGGMFVSSIPSDLRGMPNKTYSGPTYTARPTVATITRTAPPIPATATPIPPTATTQSQASLNKTAAAKLVNSLAKTAAAKLLP